MFNLPSGIFYLQFFSTFSHSTFSHSTLGHSMFSLSIFGHSMFRHGFAQPTRKGEKTTFERNTSICFHLLREDEKYRPIGNKKNQSSQCPERMRIQYISGIFRSLKFLRRVLFLLPLDVFNEEKFKNDIFIVQPFVCITLSKL
jgi:hypothetical protein